MTLLILLATQSIPDIAYATAGTLPNASWRDVPTYPEGQQVECLFAFTNRELTPTERQTFLAGNGLPSGVGMDQPVVKVDYSVNYAPVKTVGAQHDATGQYHATLTLTTPGVWKWRGYAVDGGGNPLASSEPVYFEVTAL